jgi:hypothetical protein
MLKITHNKVPMTKKRKAMVKAAHFFAKKLGILKFDVTVNIVFKYGFAELFSAYAQVEQVNARHLNLDIDADLNEDIALDIVAHEMVHVKQYVKGELGADKKGFQLWKGRHVAADLKYHNQPWEREAMRKQTVMKYQYVEFRDSEK